MKKWCLMVLAALCLLIPTVGSAQGLPDFLQAVQTGLSEGLSAGSAAMEKDLTLSVTASDARVEAGRDVTLTIRAENPRPAETRVALTLSLPERLAAQANEALAWEAALPAAEMDETGAMAYAVEIANAGTAEKTVPVELILPADVTLSGDLPEGFTRSQRQIRGEVKAAAAAGDEPFTTTLVFPMTVNEDALDGDEDAMRLLTGALRVDGKRVALPRVQLCGAKISARLLPQTASLKAGETMALRVVLVNSGLAGADVRVSCVLPEGLSLVKAEETEPETETEPEEATGGEAESALPPEADDGLGADAEPVLADEETLAEPEIRQENGAAVFSLHIDAAGEDAATRVVTLHVRADEPQENIKERLLGATLAWQTDAGETQLGEAACVRVYQPMVFGLTKDEWMGILWAGLLLVVTVSCLFAAFNSENKREKYCE